MIYIKWSVCNRCFAQQHTSKNASAALGQSSWQQVHSHALEHDFNEATVTSLSELDHNYAEA
jgi:hypothetical protein